MRVTLLLWMVTIFNCCFAQRSERALFLLKKKKKIEIRFGWLGLTTKIDTIKYFGEKDLSFEIFKVNPDSITLRGPAKYHYQVLTYTKDQYSDTVEMPKRFVKQFKKDKVFYTIYIVIDSFHYKSFKYADITSIQYPPEGSNQSGCMMCIFLVPIPGANVWLYYELRKRRHPRSYNTALWTMKVE